MSTKVTVDEALLNKCFDSALQFLADVCAVGRAGYTSDDWHDDLRSALDLCDLMSEIAQESNTERLQRIFDTEGVFSFNYCELPDFIAALHIPANDDTWMEVTDGPTPRDPKGIA